MPFLFLKKNPCCFKGYVSCEYLIFLLSEKSIFFPVGTKRSVSFLLSVESKKYRQIFRIVLSIPSYPFLLIFNFVFFLKNEKCWYKYPFEGIQARDTRIPKKRIRYSQGVPDTLRTPKRYKDPTLRVVSFWGTGYFILLHTLDPKKILPIPCCWNKYPFERIRTLFLYNTFRF